MRSRIGYLLGVSLAFLSVFHASARDFYLRAGATGANNGTDWNNAWNNTTSITWGSVGPGDTIWIAGGDYAKLTVGATGATNAPITLRRVRSTNSVPASAPGWNNSFDSQPTIHEIVWLNDNVGSWFTVDGQIDAGILVPNNTAGEDYAIHLYANGAHYIVLQYLDIKGPSSPTPVVHNGDTRAITLNPHGGATCYGARVSYCRLRGDVSALLIGGQNGLIFEHNKIYDNYIVNGSDVCCHPNAVVSTAAASRNVHFRYNEIWDWEVEGIMWLSANDHWYIYGNLWHDGAGTVSRVMEPQASVDFVYVFNNTFVNVPAYCIRTDLGGWGANCASSNNIYFAVGGAHGFNKGQDDYDLSNGSNSETHGIGGATSGIFVNYAGGNYHIVSNTAAGFPRNHGAPLTAPMNIDFDGLIHGVDGAWDIGAFEFNSGVIDTTPPTVTVTVPADSATVSNVVSLNATATDVGSGVASVKFSIDGSNVGTVNSGPFTLNWDSRSVANGAHSIQALATDLMGNQSNSTVVNFTVANVIDTTPPTVSMSAPADGSMVSNVVTLTATASDEPGGSGIGTVSFIVDGFAIGSVSNSPYSISWNSRNVTNGVHTIQATARDLSSNATTSASISVTVTNTAVAIGNGLIGYWAFDDASGTTAKDSSGYNNDGTLAGDAAWGTGALAGGLSLDGQTGYVRVPTSPNLEQVTTGVTVCAWVKFGTNVAHANGDMQTIVRKVISESDNTFPYTAYDLVVQDFGGGTFKARMAATRSDSARGTSPWGNSHNYGPWVYIVGVYDGAALHVYVNGTDEGSTAFTGTLLQTTQPLCIGRYGTVPQGEPVNGTIDEVRVYSRALSPSEIQTLYKAAAPPAPFGLKVMAN